MCGHRDVATASVSPGDTFATVWVNVHDHYGKRPCGETEGVRGGVSANRNAEIRRIYIYRPLQNCPPKHAKDSPDCPSWDPTKPGVMYVTLCMSPVEINPIRLPHALVPTFDI